MLKVRIMTVAALLPALLWLLIKGPAWGVGCLIVFAIGLSVYEMSMMLQPRLDEMLRNYGAMNGSRTDTGQLYVAASREGHYRVLALFCAAVMSSIFVVSAFYDLPAGRGIVIFGLLVTMLAGVFATKGIEAEMARVLGFTLTLVYSGFPWLIVWDLYESAPESRRVLLTLVVVWLGDTGGYFGGRFFGRTKLAPLKSPKKTREGALAGLVASVAGALVWYKYFDSALPGGAMCAMLCGFFGGIAGQLGDLVESVIKRFTGVKDSGVLLPGHGGLLDRIDGVLFAAPVIWFILYLFQFAPGA
jgi:phosphatidate cytidylyltransferase